MKVKFTAIVVALLLAASPVTRAHTNGHKDAAYHAVAADKYYRTELYFGRSIPGGGMVSDEDWQKFLADVVTPRFPEGFTIIDATGQYREKNGTIDREHSDVLVFLYPVSKRTASRRKIEEIRREYVKQFKQESVLRFDLPTPVNVTF